MRAGIRKGKKVPLDLPRYSDAAEYEQNEDYWDCSDRQPELGLVFREDDDN